LAPHKGRFTTIAVSSALMACLDAGIEPDIVVSTDGGYWSRLHLYPIVAAGSARAVFHGALAAPLTAQPSVSVYGRCSLLLLDQGSFVESELLPMLGPSLRLPPHGTVSGTALQLATRLGSGAIVAVGLDLASFGDILHARPHGFDRENSAGTKRVSPQEGKTWKRTLESAFIELAEKPWRSSRSLAAYASALSLDAKPLAGRLFRFGPGQVPLDGFARIDLRGIAEISGTAAAGVGTPKEAFCAAGAAPPLAARERALRDIIHGWRAAAAKASEALAAGIFPERPELAEFLRSIDIVDYAAARRAAVSGGDPSSAASELGRRCELFLEALQRRFAS
jgi:hypothetical protein